jgi:hypothetical protein
VKLTLLRSINDRDDTLGTSWTIQWSDESQTRQTSVASFDRTVVGLVQTTDYTVTIVASPNCGAAVSNPVTVTVMQVLQPLNATDINDLRDGVR